jgi:hypothetical protein
MITILCKNHHLAVKKALPLATECLLKTVLEFASTHKMRLDDTSLLLESYRLQDRFLVEEFIHHGFQG